MNSIGGGSQAEEPSLPDLKIYGISKPEEAFLNNEGIPEGSWIENIKQFVEQTHLSYEINIVPWQTAYNMRTRGDNILIYYLARSPERENDFHWLMEMEVTAFFLLGKNVNNEKPLSLKEAIQGRRRAVCIENSIQCGLLEQAGFREENIWRISDGEGNRASLMVDRGRADFYIQDKDFSVSEKIFYEPENPNFQNVGTLGLLKSYLAAPKNINPSLLKKLQNIE